MRSKYRSRRLRRVFRAREAAFALEYSMVVGLMMAIVISAALVPFADNIETVPTQFGAKVGAVESGGSTELK
jgi:hypothetical protein